MRNNWQGFFSKAVKFGVVGVIATCVHALVLFLLVELFAWNPVWATLAAFLCAFTASYGLNSWWTFDTPVKNKLYFVKFFVVAVTGLVLNVAVMYVFVESLQLDYFWGFGTALFLVPIVSFILNYFWTFKQ